MGVPSDDAVVIQKGKKPGEPHVVTVNCPDKTGLACDICRIILDFGLYITKGGISSVFYFSCYSFSLFFFGLFYVLDVNCKCLFAFLKLLFGLNI